MDSAKPMAGGIPMVNIDGTRIRRIREEKGLTQLYVATVVGVTTDTISRWENRRYPNIKKENALKLAEALEVQLTEIIDYGQPEPQGEPLPPPTVEPPGKEDADLPTSKPAEPEATPALEPAAPQSPMQATAPSRPRLASRSALLLVASLILTLAGFALFWRHSANNGANQVAAFRILPAHATPGMPFPVVIEVTTSSSSPFSLILKETLPPDCVPAQGKPEFSFQKNDPPVLKWIGKITGERAVYSYLAKFKPETKMDTIHQFSGGITVRSDDNPSLPVSGTDALQTSPFHWADDNGDGRIDDEELLSVYETYGGIEGLHFNRKQIEDIWAAKGYRWNQETRSYEILQ